MYYSQKASGNILIITIVSTSVLLLMGISLLTIVMSQLKILKLKKAEIYALHIAEAGINYYQWHLAHAPEDYQDGTGQPGPYEHNYYDAYGNLIGKYYLDIVPPVSGTNIITIASKGSVNIFPNKTREIETKYGTPSFVEYSFLTNSDIWFGDSESVIGPMHSNGGIRMDGINDSKITSARPTYICTPGHGCNYENKPGIWGIGPNYDLWQFPVPVVDFNLITVNLATIKSNALTNGHYYGSSNKYGYYIVLNNNNTYNIFEVTKLQSAIRQYNDDWTGWEYKAEEIKDTLFIGQYDLPPNNLIFVEDNLWIEGSVSDRITVASARFPNNPSTYTTIIINNNIIYNSYDNNHALGLIAQKNIKVPRHAPENIRIDGFLLAQHGRVFHNYYWPRSVKNNIAVYGGIITNKIWTWSWVNRNGVIVDGYRNTTLIYDKNSFLTPPPSFPTTGEYDIISWREK